MKLLRRFKQCEAFARGSVVTIGNYDGVHLGHCALISRVLQEGQRLDLPVAVMSFEPSPAEYFQKENAPARLSNWRERFEQVRELGADALYLVPFTQNIASLSPSEFIDEFLVQRLQARLVYVGDDFRFGHRRTGDIQSLTAHGERAGFSVRQLPSVELEDVRISSSRIRDHLECADFAGAEAMLGRPFSMSGRVVRGQRLGRTLGFPTANIRPHRKSLPISGVFAVRVAGAIDGELCDGVASLGVRPTVGGGEPLLEAYLFDFDGDLYGRRLRVEFAGKLRDEEHFSSVDLMVEQMHRDVAKAGALLRRTGR